MGKALIIKDADFYTNRVGIVEYADVPCTGISLDKETAQVSTTLELVASVTPINTTDIIVWSSSNSFVASVENGVVTVFSSGEATITATCGEYSASCVVTATMNYKATKEGMLQVGASATKLDTKCRCVTATQFGSIGALSGKYPCLSLAEYQSLGELLDLYPMRIPTGASKIIVTCNSYIAPIIVYFNADKVASGEQHVFRNGAEVVDGETASSGTPWSITAYEFGDRTMVIPQTEGINSFALGLRFKTPSAYNAFDVNNPGIIITYE